MKTINEKCATAFALVIATLLMWGAVGTAPTRAEITDFTPEGIQNYLNENPAVDSTEEFLLNLPVEFVYNWVMMTHSESAQTGSATSPRFILPDSKATRVFGFALDSQTIEYLHFEAATNKFRFHKIKMNGGDNGGTVTIDEKRCLDCHASTRNGVRGSRPRPNWDAYDSWGGALPFNRDRIYQNSEEEKAFKRILNDLTDDPIVKRLAYPPGFIEDPPGTGPWTIQWDDCAPPNPVPQWCKTDSGTGAVDVKYAFDPATGNVSYPGTEGPISVNQGGKYLRVTHSEKPLDSDEGRGVALFDFFTDYNALRVAQELADFPTDPVDIRYVALAIVSKDSNGDDCVTENTLGKYAHKKALKKLLAYHTMLDPNITSFADLLADTRTRMESLPKLKADLEAKNLKGLIEANGGTATPETITRDIARRSKFDPPPGPYKHDQLTGFMIDRELYDPEPDGNNETMRIALFRLFLEPVGVAVDTWSMGVQSDLVANADRNTTYTFGDLFNSKYVPKLQEKLQGALGLASVTCRDLAAASVKQFARRF